MCALFWIDSLFMVLNIRCFSDYVKHKGLIEYNFSHISVLHFGKNSVI